MEKFRRVILINGLAFEKGAEMATTIVFTLYVLTSMIICFALSKTKIGQRAMEWMLDKLTLK